MIISYVQQRIQSVFGITSAGSRQRLFAYIWPKGCENLSAPKVLKDICNARRAEYEGGAHQSYASIGESWCS